MPGTCICQVPADCLQKRPPRSPVADLGPLHEVPVGAAVVDLVVVGRGQVSHQGALPAHDAHRARPRGRRLLFLVAGLHAQARHDRLHRRRAGVLAHAPCGRTAEESDQGREAEQTPEGRHRGRAGGAHATHPCTRSSPSRRASTARSGSSSGWHRREYTRPCGSGPADEALARPAWRAAAEAPIQGRARDRPGGTVRDGRGISGKTRWRRTRGPAPAAWRAPARARVGPSLV